MSGRRNGRLAVVVLLGASLWLSGCGNDESEVSLTGTEEVPPVTTSATGEARAELDGDTLEVSGSFSGLESDLTPVSGSSAHVHNAPRGQAGPIFFNLEVTPNADNRGGTFRGSATLNDDEKDLFRDGNFYVNIHTVNNPTGEIRGQFDP